MARVRTWALLAVLVVMLGAFGVFVVRDQSIPTEVIGVLAGITAWLIWKEKHDAETKKKEAEAAQAPPVASGTERAEVAAPDEGEGGPS